MHKTYVSRRLRPAYTGSRYRERRGRLVCRMLGVNYATKVVREYLREWVFFAREFETQDTVLPAGVNSKGVIEYLARRCARQTSGVGWVRRKLRIFLQESLLSDTQHKHSCRRARPLQAAKKGPQQQSNVPICGERLRGNELMVDPVLASEISERLTRAGFRPLAAGSRWYPESPHSAQIETASQLALPLALEHGLSGMPFVLVPGGEYMMGAPASDPDARPDEYPAHMVRVWPFFMGAMPVTRIQWGRVMSYDHHEGATCGEDVWISWVSEGQLVSSARSKLDDSRRAEDDGVEVPIEDVTWYDAQQFTQALNPGFRQPPIRLPAETEWEWAARGMTTSRYWWGDSIRRGDCSCAGEGFSKLEEGEEIVLLREIDRPTRIGLYPANPFGLFDMLGNVHEWCDDNWHDSYEGAPTDGSPWIDHNNAWRVVRGGNDWLASSDVRVTVRRGLLSDCEAAFRCVLDIEALSTDAR